MRSGVKRDVAPELADVAVAPTLNPKPPANENIQHPTLGA